MKNIFDTGFHTHWLGQEAEESYTTVFEPERNRILAEIQSGLAKVPAIDDLIAWSSANDPELRRTLGADYSRFWALSNSIAPLYRASVGPVLERMSDPDPEFWLAPTAKEAQDIRTWVTGVSEMARIVAAHPATPQAVLPYGTAPRPDLPKPAASPAPAEPMILGLPQNYVVGGGLALGLGLLLYALA